MVTKIEKLDILNRKSEDSTPRYYLHLNQSGTTKRVLSGIRAGNIVRLQFLRSSLSNIYGIVNYEYY